MPAPSPAPGLHIALLSEAFYPIVGGAETHSRILAAELVQLGVRVTVVTRRSTAALAREEQVAGACVLRVGPCGLRRLGKYGMIPGVHRALRSLRGQIDLLYVCGFRVLGLPALAAGRELGIPVVLRAEMCGELAGDFARRDGAASWPGVRPLLDAALRARARRLREADLFLSIAGAVAAEYQAWGVPAERIAHVPNGVALGTFEPCGAGQKAALRQRLGLPADRIVWCYTGKLNRRKGLELLLDVWRELAAHDERLHLVLVGGGAYHALSCEAELRAYVAAHDLGGRVQFTGYVHDVASYLRAADYFVLPSEEEALSVSVIEALACGLPALSTTVGGTPEIIEDGKHGRLVPPRDRAALLRAMQALVADPEQARRLAAAGRERAASTFDIRAVARAHRTVFETLAREPRPVRAP